MKVYVVTSEHEHENSYLLGVRSTREKAQALAQEDAREGETIAWKEPDSDGDQYGYGKKGSLGLTTYWWTIYEREVAE